MFCPWPFVMSKFDLAEGGYAVCIAAFCYFYAMKERNQAMSLLEITELTHAYGDNQLYKNAELTLNKGEHIGIVGQNGVGKSTLIQVCTECVVPDQGRILWQPKITIGYLDQYAKIEKQITMKDFLKLAFQELYEIERKMNKLYEEASKGDKTALNRASACQERLERCDFYSIDMRIDQITSGLGLSLMGFDRPIGQMSGGWRAKVILAKLLLEKPDVLLLDEPTNFLDKEHIAWLADYLSALENAFMVVSHDYGFLEKVTNRICDLDNHVITKYYGAYSEFLKKKTVLRQDYIRQYSAQQKEIKKTEEFIRKNIAGRKSKMARGRQKQLNRMDKMAALGQKESKPIFHFPEMPLTETEHLRVSHLSVGYGKPVLSDLNFSIKGGQKIVITGFNGIGKSTLLKTLVGQIGVLKGSFAFSKQVSTVYFEQDLSWEDGKRTPLEVVSDQYPALVMKEIRECLARCGISSKHVMQPIGTLSGGEQAKVKMCLLTLNPSNFIIMDEPANHLDARSKEALKEALSLFSGTVLLVSHEENFYRDWVHRIIDIAREVP